MVRYVFQQLHNRGLMAWQIHSSFSHLASSLTE